MFQPDDEASLRDLAALQGVWEQIRHEADGSVDAPDDYGSPGALTTIEGTTFSVRDASGALLLHGRFELDARCEPKAITWIDAIGADRGKRLPASYRLDGDRFLFIAAGAGAPQPTTFRTGPGQTLRGFARRSRAGRGAAG
jgi:uncharacterized protein (TIGR03067 family)